MPTDSNLLTELDCATPLTQQAFAAGLFDDVLEPEVVL